LAFGVILLLVRRFLAYAWCHLELFAQFTLHSSIRVGAELHLLFHSLSYMAELF
jgi:hypothetical protein